MPRPPLPVQTKACLHCGQTMERKRYNGTLEDRTTFRRRMYCDQKCMGAARRKRELSKSGWRYRVRSQRRASCEACSDSRKLQVHHCDGDLTNTDPSNLQTLCKWCHDFWHATLKRRSLPISGRVPRLVP